LSIRRRMHRLLGRSKMGTTESPSWKSFSKQRLELQLRERDLLSGIAQFIDRMEENAAC
jgi:hypothetical protein